MRNNLHDMFNIYSTFLSIFHSDRIAKAPQLPRLYVNYLGGGTGFFNSTVGKNMVKSSRFI